LWVRKSQVTMSINFNVKTFPWKCAQARATLRALAVRLRPVKLDRVTLRPTRARRPEKERRLLVKDDRDCEWSELPKELWRAVDAVLCRDPHTTRKSSSLHCIYFHRLFRVESEHDTCGQRWLTGTVVRRYMSNAVRDRHLTCIVPYVT